MAGRIAAEAFEVFGVRSEVHNAGFHHSARSLHKRYKAVTPMLGAGCFEDQP
jgi:hypothetical protein